MDDGGKIYIFTYEDSRVKVAAFQYSAGAS